MANMKVKITGYNQADDVFTYEVTGLLTQTDRTISGTELNALSTALPHSHPGQMTDVEILLAQVYDEFFKEEPHDIIGHEATLYTVIKLRPQELRPGCVPLNSNTVKHLKLTGE